MDMLSLYEMPTNIQNILNGETGFGQIFFFISQITVLGKFLRFLLKDFSFLTASSAWRKNNQYVFPSHGQTMSEFKPTTSTY